MAADDDFYVRFWGVRGSIACASSDVLKYGGNTSSLEIRCGGHLLLFDAGTGIRYLGNEMMKAGGPYDADLFLTHTHLDHIAGLPFFRPMFSPDNRFRVWAGHLLPRQTIHEVLKQMMMAPLFPVPPDVFQAEVCFNDFEAGETLFPCPGVTLRTAPLNHPDGATGYRVEFQGKSICYLTDIEHEGPGPDPALVELVRGADIVIYDCMFTEREYEHSKGWGHSTWPAGVALCDAAEAKTFVVFHHDPDHDDVVMDRIAEEVAAARPGSLVAREGLVLRP